MKFPNEMVKLLRGGELVSFQCLGFSYPFFKFVDYHSNVSHHS